MEDDGDGRDRRSGDAAQAEGVENPAVHRRQWIGKHVELQEFGSRIFFSVLDDEVVDDIGADIAKSRRPFDMLHPMEIAAGGVKQRTY